MKILSSYCLAGLLGLVLLAPSTRAFSTGAGGCDRGAAVGGAHLMRDQVVTGSLSDGMLTATLTSASAGTVLPLDAAEIEVAAGESYTLTATGTSEYVGFLFRLAGPEGIDLVEADTSLGQAASACAAPVLGVTHRNSFPKNSVSANLTVPEGTSTLDITIVYANTAALSEYYSSGFALKGEVPVDPDPFTGGGLDFDCVPDETGGYLCVYTGEPSFPFRTPDSYVTMDCVDNLSLGTVVPTSSSCSCDVYIGTIEDVNNTRACNSCSILPTTSEMESFQIFYNCANLLEGPCTGRSNDLNCTASMYDLTVDVVVDAGFLGEVPVTIDVIGLMEGDVETGTLEFDGNQGVYSVTLEDATNDSVSVGITFRAEGFESCDFAYGVTLLLDDSGVGQSNQETVETCTVFFTQVVINAQLTVMRN